jgi:hypothetical protein
MSAWADERCLEPAASPTVTLAAEGLMLMIGAAGVR